LETTKAASSSSSISVVMKVVEIKSSIKLSIRSQQKLSVMRKLQQQRKDLLPGSQSIKS